jgi:hypothetical protein
LSVSHAPVTDSGPRSTRAIIIFGLGKRRRRDKPAVVSPGMQARIETRGLFYMYSSKQKSYRGSHPQPSTEASSSSGLVSTAAVTTHGDAPSDPRKGSGVRAESPVDLTGSPGQQPGRRSKSVRSSAPREDRAGHRPRAAGTRATRNAAKISQSTHSTIAALQAAQDARS